MKARSFHQGESVTTSSCWVLVECPEGKILRASLEALSAGQSVGKQTRWPFTALWTGVPPEDTQVRYLGTLGVEKLIVLDKAGNGSSAPPLYMAEELGLLLALKRLYLEHRPGCFLFGSSPLSLSLAPRLAALTHLGYMASTTYLRRVGEVLQLTRPALQEKLSEILSFTSQGPGLTSLSPRSFGIPGTVPGGGEGQPLLEVIPFSPSSEGSGHCERVSMETESPGNMSVEDAEIVVAGGRGLGSKANFAMLYELAGLLGGAVAASRIAVDLGWASKEKLVGQSGRRVEPELYIACGISGAPQHREGMKGSRYILAINQDEKAPIFQAATWGVLGDATQVVPQMIRSLREAGSSSQRKAEG